MPLQTQYPKIQRFQVLLTVVKIARNPARVVFSAKTISDAQPPKAILKVDIRFKSYKFKKSHLEVDR